MRSGHLRQGPGGTIAVKNPTWQQVFVWGGEKCPKVLRTGTDTITIVGETLSDQIDVHEISEEKGIG